MRHLMWSISVFLLTSCENQVAPAYECASEQLAMISHAGDQILPAQAGRTDTVYHLTAHSLTAVNDGPMTLDQCEYYADGTAICEERGIGSGGAYFRMLPDGLFVLTMMRSDDGVEITHYILKGRCKLVEDSK